MIRRNLRRLSILARSRLGREADHRPFIRLAYEATLRREPDEREYRDHEAALAGGRSLSTLLVSLKESEEYREIHERATSASHISARVDENDADRLVRMAFSHLLRREPDAETYAAYRAGFASGTTFHDLVNDIIASEEFKIVDQRIEGLLAASNHPPPPAPSPAPQIASEMSTALTLLETRLGEKGCKLQLGAAPAGATDGASAQRRMRSLLVTISLMEQL